MTGTAKFAAAAKRNADGFTLLELVTVVAILGILAVMAIPSITRMLQQQETKSSATEMAGLLSDARSRALAEGTPYLVYFNPPSVDGNGDCGAAAVEVRDSDHSYSITDGDKTREFHLPASACNKVTPFSAASAKLAAVPMPVDDLAVRAPDAGLVGAVASSTGPAVAAAASSVGSAVSGAAAAASGKGSSASSGSGSSASSGEDSSGDSSSEMAATAVARTSTVSETVVNGATFPVDPASGRPVIAFSERGIPVDPADPSAWGAGAGGIYLTDGDSTVYAALVQPLGDVQLRGFDAASGTWK